VTSSVNRKGAFTAISTLHNPSRVVAYFVLLQPLWASCLVHFRASSVTVYRVKCNDHYKLHFGVGVLGRQRSLRTLGNIFSLRDYKEPQENRETNRYSNQALPNRRSESYWYTNLYYGTGHFQPTQKFCDRYRCLTTFIHKRVIKNSIYRVFNLVTAQWKTIICHFTTFLLHVSATTWPPSRRSPSQNAVMPDSTKGVNMWVYRAGRHPPQYKHPVTTQGLLFQSE
jgi:hypothetical protein